MTTKNHSNSAVCTVLKNFISTLSHDAISQTLRHLLQAIFVALAKGEKHEKLAKRIRGERCRKSSLTASLSIEKAKKEIVEIKRLRKLCNRMPLIPGAKKLERYHAEIISLHQAGASLREVKFWLLSHKKVVVSHHSVQRYINTVLNHEKNE